MGTPLELDLENYRPPEKKKDGILKEDDGLEESLRRLEEEKKKIDAFKRELPFCMILINDAIETVKEQMSRKRCLSDGPVLEEFIPLKKSCGEKDENECLDSLEEEKDCRDKMNWMSSAQLWIDVNANSNTCKIDDEHESPDQQETSNKFEAKFSVSSTRGVVGGGSSAIGLKERPRSVAKTKDRKDVTPDLCLSTEPKSNGRIASSSGNQHGLQAQPQFRKARRCWSPELHKRFLNALTQLGGSRVATPKQIRELMKVDGLTNDEVKSHLQKYRLHTSRPAAPSPRPGNQQLVLLGKGWIQPEYASQDCNRMELKYSPPQSRSPEGPLQFAQNRRSSEEEENGDEDDDDDDDDEDTKSESYSWRSHPPSSEATE